MLYKLFIQKENISTVDNGRSVIKLLFRENHEAAKVDRKLVKTLGKKALKTTIQYVNGANVPDTGDRRDCNLEINEEVTRSDGNYVIRSRGVRKLIFRNQG